jgi:hypothetical protein
LKGGLLFRMFASDSDGSVEERRKKVGKSEGLDGGTCVHVAFCGHTLFMQRGDQKFLFWESTEQLSTWFSIFGWGTP